MKNILLSKGGGGEIQKSRQIDICVSNIRPITSILMWHKHFKNLAQSKSEGGEILQKVIGTKLYIVGTQNQASKPLSTKLKWYKSKDHQNKS